jgi:transketolase
MTTPSLLNTGNKDTRSGFGAGLLALGAIDDRVVALCADLTGSLKMDAFQAKYPDRFLQCGIAEANMIGVAAGLAVGGKIPFTGTFANFSTGRVYDQIRQSVCYSETNVKICASHAGLSLGEDGATHQILEDIGLMKMLPKMTVVVPCDFNQTRAATLAVATWQGPVYLRFGRPSVPNFTPVDGADFRIGQADVLLSGTDAVVFSCGHLVWPAIEAAQALAREGLTVAIVNVHTIKPLDEATILAQAATCRAVVVAEEHQMAGGLGESIAALLGRKLPTVFEQVAVQDSFGESGTPAELLQKYGLDQAAIVAGIRRALARK